MRIAVGLPQIGDSVDAVLRAARDAEDAGAWGVWVFDNLQGLVRPEAPVLEGWSLLGPIAGATERVRLISLVTRAGLRHPALVARMAAVMQDASHGRLVVGLGAGDAQGRREEHRFGIEVPGGRAERMRQLEDTARRLRGGDPLPVRPVAPPPAIWIGGRAGDLVDAVASTRADGWHGWDVDPQRFADTAAKLDPAVERWWGGAFSPATAEDTLASLPAATGVTWMIASRHEDEHRPRLLELVRRRA